MRVVLGLVLGVSLVCVERSARTRSSHGCRLPDGTRITTRGVDLARLGPVRRSINVALADRSPPIHHPTLDQGARLGWELSAPPDTDIAGYTLFRSSAVLGGGYPNRGAADHYDAPVYDGASMRYTQVLCMQYVMGCAGWGDSRYPMAPTNRCERAGLQTHRLILTACYVTDRSVPQVCPPVPSPDQAYVSVHSSRMSLEDATPRGRRGADRDALRPCPDRGRASRIVRGRGSWRGIGNRFGDRRRSHPERTASRPQRRGLPPAISRSGPVPAHGQGIDRARYELHRQRSASSQHRGDGRGWEPHGVVARRGHRSRPGRGQRVARQPVRTPRGMVRGRVVATPDISDRELRAYPSHRRPARQRGRRPHQRCDARDRRGRNPTRSYDAGARPSRHQCAGRIPLPAAISVFASAHDRLPRVPPGRGACSAHDGWAQRPRGPRSHCQAATCLPGRTDQVRRAPPRWTWPRGHAGRPVRRRGTNA